MIYIFRKEIKKWTSIIWVFILSIPLGGLSYWIFRKPLPNEVIVAKINGAPIYLNEYNHEVAKVHMRIEMIREYARAQGFPADIFLALEGLNKPEEIAMQELMNEKLLDKIHYDFGLELDHNYLILELGKSIPQSLFDKNGKINERYYRDYLRRLFLNIDEFEKLKENEFKRNIVTSFIANSLYIPTSRVLEIFEKNHGKKSFNILKISFHHFLNKVKAVHPSDEALEEYFNNNKENYKVFENRKAQYFEISKEDYQKNITVDDEAIEAFYEKNKNSMFRISPQVKLRKIVVGMSSDSSAKDKATRVLDEARKKPGSFSELVRKYSIDKDSVAKGGIVEFFSKGTYSNEFETAAFRLKDINEISDVINDGENYLIIQLLERKPAQVKPLDEATNEIVRIIKERKSVSKLKSDLELLMRRSKNDSKGIEKFAETHKLKSHVSDWLNAELAKGYSLQSLLSKKIFEKNKSSANFGYFEYEGKFIIFKEISRAESYIPSFEEIKTKVKEDYWNLEAQKEIKLFAKNAKIKLIAEDTTLENIASSISLPIKTTGLVGINDKVSFLENSQDIINKAFDLNDKSQVLKLKSMPDYYIIQLEKSAPINMENFDKQKDSILSEEFKAKKSLYLRAFIASLVRNARIDQYENSLKTSTVSAPIEYADID